MVGTSLKLQGGVAAVIQIYREYGFFKRWNVEYIPTNEGNSRSSKVLGFLSAILKFLILLVRGGGDIVHIHTSSEISFGRKSFFIFLSLIFNRLIVISLHGGGFREFYGSRGIIGRWWIRFSIRRSTRFIVLTDSWKQWTLSIVPLASVCIIPNVCPDPCHIRQEIYLADFKNNILFLGRLEKEKGFKDLLSAVAYVRRSIPEVRLVCGGTGDESEVKKWVEKAGISDVVDLRGWISGYAKHECFQQAALLVLPSYIENLPMVIIEAMAAGLPIVASNVGGIPDVIETGNEGLLVRPGDVIGLSEAIITILKDQTMRRDMAWNARRKYEKHYSPQRVIPQLDLIYEELGVAVQYER